MSCLLIVGTPSPAATTRLAALTAGSGRLLGTHAMKLKSNGKCKLSGCRSQMAELAPAASATYGFLLLGGGLFAFTRSGSKGSLYGGLTGSALMASAYFLMQSPESKAVGDAIGFGSAFLFSAVFGIRLVASRRLVPAGPLLAVSIGMLAVFTLAYMQDSI